jgi:hypothetical protein
MQTYRAAWLRATTIVLLVGWTAAIAAVLIPEPRMSAVIFAATLFVLAARGGRYAAGAGDQPRQLGPAIWLALAPPEAKLLIFLGAAMTCGIGLTQMVGSSGTELVLLDAAAGVPLLFMPRPGAPLNALTANEKPKAFPFAWASPIEAARSEHPVPAVPPSAARPGNDAQSPEPEDVLRARFAAMMDLPLSEEPPLRLNGGPPDPAGAQQPTGALGVAELCHAWQASSHALRLTLSPAERVRIVAARSIYLDALIRYDTDGTARWIDQGDPDNDPRQYLSPPDPSNPSCD